MARTGISGAALLREMVASGAATRRELGERLGLSKGSISRTMDALLQAGLVEEGLRRNDSSRGRKTTSLRVKPDLAYLLGADLEGLAVRACLLDSSRQVVASSQQAIDPHAPMAVTVRQWMDLVEEVIRRSGVDRSRIAAVGLGLPGIVSREGLQIRAHLPAGRAVEFDFGPALAPLRLPVTAANNVICVSEYERRVGVARGAASFISVLVRYGIGAVLYSHGSFLVGEGTFAGEFGHMRIDPAGPMCVCGRRGCLDVF